MTDRKALVDQNETPEDVATLYSWANLHGAKYRDFSASRAQMREKARQRVQEAMAAERLRAQEEAEKQKVIAAQQGSEIVRAAEAARQAEMAAYQTLQAAQQAAAWQQSRLGGDRVPAVPNAGSGSFAASPISGPQPAFDPQAGPLTYQAEARAPLGIPPGYAQASFQRAESYPSRRTTLPVEEPREDAGRPAWLTSERAEAVPAPLAPTPEDTLQGSRDRLTTRWFALKGVFEGAGATAEAAPNQVQTPSRAPVLAFFSLAGGVGKTSLVATLGRALSAHGERVLLVDTAAYGLLPFFFGARDQRPGMLRTFNPPSSSSDAPIQMVTLETESLGPENAAQEALTTEIVRNAHGASRVIVDLATASGTITRRILRMAPTVVVPLAADMSSVVSVGSIDAFFQHNAGVSGKAIRPYYLLNQFDPSLPLHLDVREVLREQLGDRLLPFVIRRAPAVSEALAEGMTVMDYAPGSPAAEDMNSLASWVKSLAAPAASGHRGVRWSER